MNSAPPTVGFERSREPGTVAWQVWCASCGWPNAWSDERAVGGGADSRVCPFVCSSVSSSFFLWCICLSLLGPSRCTCLKSEGIFVPLKKTASHNLTCSLWSHLQYVHSNQYIHIYLCWKLLRTYLPYLYQKAYIFHSWALPPFKAGVPHEWVLEMDEAEKRAVQTSTNRGLLWKIWQSWKELGFPSLAVSHSF